MTIDKNTKKHDSVGRQNTKIVTNENFIIILKIFITSVLSEFKSVYMPSLFNS